MIVPVAGMGNYKNALSYGFPLEEWRATRLR
jgi:hypothetical protein